MSQSLHLPLVRAPQIPSCSGLPVPPPPSQPVSSSFSPPHVLLLLTETLASAKEENVEIHQTLDQTLLELNNL